MTTRTLLLARSLAWGLVLSAAGLAPAAGPDASASPRAGGTTVFRDAVHGDWRIVVQPAVRTAQADAAQVLPPTPRDAGVESAGPLVSPRDSASPTAAEEQAPAPQHEPPAAPPENSAPSLLREAPAPYVVVEPEVIEDFGMIITPGPKSSDDDLVNGRSYAKVYKSIPFSRSEHLANPSYRHDSTMEILFGQLRPTTIIRQQAPRAPEPQYYSPYKPYIPFYRDYLHWRGLPSYGVSPYVWPFPVRGVRVHTTSVLANWWNAPPGGCVWP